MKGYLKIPKQIDDEQATGGKIKTIKIKNINVLEHLLGKTKNGKNALGHSIGTICTLKNK